MKGCLSLLAYVVLLTITLTHVPQVARKPCFAQLRTTEQLGYFVQSGVSSTADALAWVVRVQSPTKNPAYVTVRIRATKNRFLA